MAKPGLPLAAAAGSSLAWRSRVALGNVGVLALAALLLSGGLRIAAWTAVLAGFGTSLAGGGGAGQGALARLRPASALRKTTRFRFRIAARSASHHPFVRSTSFPAGRSAMRRITPRRSHAGRGAAFMTVARRCPQPGHSPPGVSQQSVSAIFRSFYKSI